MASPSFASKAVLLSAVFAGANAYLLPRELELASASTCSSSLPYSCQNTTKVASSNLCCFNSPGGSLLQTQFWDTDPEVRYSDILLFARRKN